MNEIKEFTQDQINAIKLVELAGYIIKENENTFQLWDNNVKLYGYSSYSFLNTSYMMKTIKYISYRRGYKKGQNNMRKQIADLFKPEE